MTRDCSPARPSDVEGPAPREPGLKPELPPRVYSDMRYTPQGVAASSEQLSGGCWLAESHLPQEGPWQGAVARSHLAALPLLRPRRPY
eukprot:COSAG01_NODE_2358_length_7838_cov_7.568807_3_plen_88_part_00